MKRKSYIKRAILSFVEKNSVIFTDHSNWYIGVTADPKKRLSAHGAPNTYAVWETDHPDHAREIEKHFLGRGFSGAPGGGTRPKHVYIYKHSGPFS